MSSTASYIQKALRRDDRRPRSGSGRAFQMSAIDLRQRQSGAAHVPAARVPSGGFRILQGTPKRYVSKADSGNDIIRVFCGDCGTPLYVQVGTRPDLVGLRVCTLDDPGWFKPDADIFMKSAQPWDLDQPNVPKYDAYPPGQSYPTAPSRDG